jgi:hypothetical protein
VPALRQLAARSKKPAALEECRRLATEIIDHWRPHQPEAAPGNVSYSGLILESLERIGSLDLAVRFVKEVLPTDFNGSEGKAVQRLCERFGWQHFADALRELISSQQPDNYYVELEHVVAICEALCCEPPVLTEDRRSACASFADELLHLFERWDKEPHDDYNRDQKRTGVVAKVIRILGTLSAEEHLDRFVAHALADPQRYDIREVLVPAIRTLYRGSGKLPAARPAAARLLEHCLRELHQATAQTVEAPKDWARDAKLNCQCAPCRAVNEFLRDPAQRVGRFPLRKELRRHLHGEIDSHRCDLTHVTERKGSPQTLVCTKTNASYERRLKQYQVDQKVLAELQTLAGDGKRAIARTPQPRRMKRS